MALPVPFVPLVAFARTNSDDDEEKVPSFSLVKSKMERRERKTPRRENLRLRMFLVIFCFDVIYYKEHT